MYPDWRRDCAVISLWKVNSGVVLWRVPSKQPGRTTDPATDKALDAGKRMVDQWRLGRLVPPTDSASKDDPEDFLVSGPLSLSRLPSTTVRTPLNAGISKLLLHMLGMVIPPTLEASSSSARREVASGSKAI